MMNNLMLRTSTAKTPAINIDNHGYNLLHSLLAENISTDPYMNSPAYVAMTGRKGLFVYEGQFSNILYAQHPNIHGVCIIFPPKDPKGINDVARLVKKLKPAWRKVQLIRVPEEIASFWATLLRGTVIQEDVLDYAFPVHTLDIDLLLEMKGSKLYNFKKTLCKIDQSKVSERPIDFEKDSQIILKILTEWGRQVNYNPDVNTAEPALFVCDSLSKNFPLYGMITYLEGKPVGFSIWEKPKEKSNTANAVIHCALHIQGLSELLHYQMAKELHTEGIRHLCIGGAETAGLDAFKRKMRPVLSSNLKTINC